MTKVLIPVDNANPSVAWLRKLRSRLLGKNKLKPVNSWQPIDNVFCRTGKGGGVNATCKKHPGAELSSSLRVEEADERVFTGEPVELKTKLTKQETGRIGEKVVLDYLKNILGKSDAQFMNSEDPDFPFDLIEGHHPMEVKTGLVSNRKDAQKWRLTFSQESLEEKELYAAMSSEDKAEWNRTKVELIKERKQDIVRDIEKECKCKISPRTVGVILNPDKQMADIYMVEGVHPILRWNNSVVKGSYLGSVKYAAD